MSDPTLAERLTQAALELQSAPDLDSTMETALHLAATNVPGCDMAGISLLTKDGTSRTPAWTDELVLRADQLQYSLREGPCLRAAWDERVVHSGDLASDARWPIWGPRVAQDHGLQSVLCLQLFTHEDTLGALNLYSRGRDAFAERDREEALALAAHVAVAVASADAQEHLRRAVDARTLIGQAVGIVMERYQVDAATAFRVLVRTSSHANVKLRLIAHELVETGTLRGTTAADAPTAPDRVEDVP